MEWRQGALLAEAAGRGAQAPIVAMPRMPGGTRGEVVGMRPSIRAWRRATAASVIAASEVGQRRRWGGEAKIHRVPNMDGDGKAQQLNGKVIDEVGVCTVVFIWLDKEELVGPRNCVRVSYLGRELEDGHATPVERRGCKPTN